MAVRQGSWRCLSFVCVFSQCITHKKKLFNSLYWHRWLFCLGLFFFFSFVFAVDRDFRTVLLCVCGHDGAGICWRHIGAVCLSFRFFLFGCETKTWTGRQRERVSFVCVRLSSGQIRTDVCVRARREKLVQLDRLVLFFPIRSNTPH